MYSSTPTRPDCATEHGERTDALATVYRAGTRCCDATRPAGIFLRERRGLQLINLRGAPQLTDFFAATARALECALPVTPNTAACGPRCNVLWLGPNEWLLAGAPDAALADVLRSVGNSLTDISHGRSVVRVNGSAVHDLLAKGCALDFHPRSFRCGNCAQTAIARVNVLLHQIGETAFDLYIARSYAQYFWEWLTESAAEFGYEVIAPDV
jgi:sarcosine oxidase subunit gamma